SPVGSELFYVMTAGTRDTLVWMQNAEPLSLYCGDESDGETLRACEQIFESLYTYEIGGTKAIPALATGCAPNADLTVWTCTLRQGVKFQQGGTLDANDVVNSYAVQWDTQNPLHVGNTGDFEYFPGLFGGYLNPPAS
ncbi:MAG TPA: ABC transporter substrate-binding protein, partial [Candidatus Acidoferrales bacterium]|nr:ABC transporter substrate-binding protein [Candidatus Acidoferrales bacterium]